MPTRPGLVPSTYWASPSVYRFTVEQYERMAEAGILTKYDKVELLEGYVVYKMPRNPPHDGTIQVITKRLGRRIPAGWDGRVQLTVALPDSQPEPDFAVARGDEATYLARHPTAAEVGLVVEVADSSLDRDQAEKGRLYARAGIPAYWIINLVDRQVEVYTQPSGPAAVPAYGSLVTYTAGEDVPLVLDGAAVATIPAADLLP
ncbi:MAG: Uma2 family endonuclease [Gemmataceae bacterium]|nr:Uma2 family endonuclease [Gemmataceae bacterium]